jgi:hypothetical protein
MMIVLALGYPGRFDDRRADQDVRLVIDELQHHVFQLALAHLAVADEDAGIGDELLNLIGHLEMLCTRLWTK